MLYQDDSKSEQNLPTEHGIVHKIFIESCCIFNKKLPNKISLFFIISAIIWLVLLILFDQKALPGGSYFSLWVLVTCSHILGFIFEMVKMPSLLGKEQQQKNPSYFYYFFIQRDANNRNTFQKCADNFNNWKLN